MIGLLPDWVWAVGVFGPFLLVAWGLCAIAHDADEDMERALREYYARMDRDGQR